MKEVYQTIVDKGNGNCMQAVVASLFEVPLEQIPHFLEIEGGWITTMLDIYKEHGYRWGNFDVQDMPMGEVKKALKHDGGIGGFFYGVVDSLTYPGEATHAVVVDKHLNIIHDPNPNQLAMKLRPEDVKFVHVTRNDWYIDGKTNKFYID